VDHNLLEKAGHHAGDISAITGIAAYGLAFTPLAPLSPFLGGVSLITGALSSYQNFKDGRIVGGVTDAVGAAAGGAALIKGFRAGREAVAMTRATEAAVDAIQAGRRTDAIGLSRLADTKYSQYDHDVAQARASSMARHTAKETADALETVGLPVNIGNLTDSHAKDVGIRILPPRVAAFGVP
jgi:hypothetical protein